nr:hypothetical protein [Methanosarcina sp. KYL-1]
MQDFLKVSKEVIPLENSAVKIKQEKKEETAVLEKRIQDIDQYLKDMTDYIEERTLGVDAEEILEIKMKTLEAISTTASAKKDEAFEELETKAGTARMELHQLETKMLSILSPFFEAGIYEAKHAYSASVEEKKLKGKQASSFDGMKYEFDLIFTQDMLKVEDLHELVLPVWVKSGILRKEEKIKKLDVSDFHVMSAEYEGDSLKTVFEDKDAEHRFTVSADEKAFLIQYGDYEITGDEELAASINMDSLHAVVKKLKDFFRESVKSRKLTRILLEGENAVEENRVMDSLKLIAGTYGKLVRECIDRGYTNGEITIKIEEQGIRTEKYIGTSEVLSQLTDLGSEGLELAKILGVAKT